MRILLAEDEQFLARAMVKLLQKNNYSVDVVHNGQDAYDYLMSENYDVAIVDIMMPKMDGITVVKNLRSVGSFVPILLLSAKSQTEDKVLGLDSGANDYLTKPFDVQELLARLRVLTRSTHGLDSTLSLGNVTLNRATYEMGCENQNIRLSNKEFQIMEMFMSNPKQIYASEYLLEKIWGYDTDAEINVVWVYISYLRKKLHQLDANIQIKSYRNAGYSLEVTNK